MIGETVSHFEVLDVLGEGGMGIVYKARDLNLDRLVALKFPPRYSVNSDSGHERFIVEAKAAGSLNHANICTVYEYDEVDGRALIAMECVDGPTLQNILSDGSLPVEEALDLAGQIARGLAAAHAKGVVHRDIKPGNVLLAGGTTVKITDFGLAKIENIDLTQTGMTMGTVAYMAPEQALGTEISPATDIWALGVILYEMLTGQTPFPGDYATAKLYSVVQSEPLGMDEIESEFGQPVKDLIASMLDKKPDARPSATEVAEMLKPSGSTTTFHHPVVARSRPGVSYRKLGAAIAAMVIIGGVALSFFSAGPSVDLSNSSVAMLPVVIEDSSLKITLDGLIGSTSAMMSRVAEDQNVIGQMVPFGDVLDQNVHTPEDAFGKLGAAFAIETRVTGIDPIPTVQFTLMKSEGGETMATTSMPVLTSDLHQSYLAALRHVSELLGVSDTSLISVERGSISSDPEAFSLYTRANGLLQQGRTPKTIETAIGLYTRALEQSPSFAPALAGLGQAHLYQFEALKDADDLEKAERLSDRAIELDADLMQAYVTLGSVHVNKGKPGQARTVLEMALRQEPFNVDALVGLASVFEALDDYNQAEATLKRAIASRPDYWAGYRRLGSFYYRQSNYELAAVQYQKITELAPMNSLGYRNLGSMYYFMGRLEEAAQLWRESLDIEPSYSGLSNLGVLSFNLGD